MLDKTRPSVQPNPLRPLRRRIPASKGKGGKYEAAPLQSPRSHYPTEDFVCSSAHARDCEAYAARIEEAHPEADLSPHSIRASQEALEERCRANEAKQHRILRFLGL